jgi:hypothetical protein
MTRFARRARTFGLVLGTALTPATALAAPGTVSFAELGFAALDPKTDVEMRPSATCEPTVRVVGATLAVRIAARTTDKQRMSFGIQHVDAGSQRFDVAIAAVPGTGEGHGTGEGRVALEFDAAVPGTGEGRGSLKLSPSFSDTKTYRIRVKRKGIVVHDLRGRSEAFTIPDFEGAEEPQKTETLGVSLRWEGLGKGAWALVVEHEGFEIAIAPEVEQVFAGVPELNLRAGGLDEIQLVGLGARARAASDGATPSGGKGQAGLAEGGFR